MLISFALALIANAKEGKRLLDIGLSVLIR